MRLEAAFLQAGHCLHPEASVIPGGSWCARRFPALAVLLKHPGQGYVLFDSGYSPLFHELTQELPWKLYAWLTKVSIPESETVAEQLRRAGIRPDEIKTIVISHFHADHIGGLRDFPLARFAYHREAYAALKSLKPLAALRAGFLKGLLPDDFEERSLALDDGQFQPSAELRGLRSMDLFGDASLSLVSLPGHAAGHCGLRFNDTLLIGDAVWLKRSLDELRPPRGLAGLLMHNRRKFKRTFESLCALESSGLRLLPSHCQESLEGLPGLEPKP